MTETTLNLDHLNLPDVCDCHDFTIQFEYLPMCIDEPESADVLTIEDEDGNCFTWLLTNHRREIEQAILDNKNEGFDYDF
jgi:hypothetical protein